MGFKQHDSQEFLSIFLETLHEDVNLVEKKPYFEHKDSEQNRSDLEISNEYWEFFKKREQSIFIDLFYGQLKSKVQCTRCGHLSLSFDAFNVLSLPIPTQSQIELKLKFIPRLLTQQPYIFNMTISEFMTLLELKQRLREFFQVDKDHTSEPFVTLLQPCKDNSKSLRIVSDEQFVKSI
jgi:hypothetical protein